MAAIHPTATHKVAELDGALLDKAAAVAYGYAMDDQYEFKATPLGGGWRLNEWQPSSKWSQAGPIIGRERITIVCSTGYGPTDGPVFWVATVGAFEHYIDDPLTGPGPINSGDDRGFGPTPLIAAMRAFVASKLGAEVEL